MGHLSGFLRPRRIQLCVLAGLLMLFATIPLSAEEPQPEVNAADAIKHQLDQQVGKRAKVKLRSGQGLDGKVLKVGSNGLHLAELTGMEFFDAVIRLEAIDAVIVRVTRSAHQRRR